MPHHCELPLVILQRVLHLSHHVLLEPQLLQTKFKIRTFCQSCIPLFVLLKFTEYNEQNMLYFVKFRCIISNKVFGNLKSSIQNWQKPVVSILKSNLKYLSPQKMAVIHYIIYVWLDWLYFFEEENDQAFVKDLCLHFEDRCCVILPGAPWSGVRWD